MLPRVLWTLLLLLEAKSLNADTNIFKVEVPVSANSQPREGLEYENYNETMLPSLSRDLTLLQQSIDTIEDSVCRNQCQLVLSSLENLTSWAVKFYDASGKFPTGILAGSVYQLGNFDECLDINIDDETPPDIRGQYCLAEVDVRVPESYLRKRGSIWESFEEPKDRNREAISKLYWGICVPASCAPEVVEEGIRNVLSVIFSGSQLKLTLTIPETSCHTAERPPIDRADTVYMSVILLMLFIIAASTIFHAMHLRNKDRTPSGTLPQVFIAFSLISNVKKLLSPTHDSELHLDCISGIKTISMCLIIAGHCLIFVASGPVFNKKFWEEAIEKMENSAMVNNPLLVDTFLLLSGFLFCRLLLRELDRRKSVNFFLLYVFRYIRLTPVYVIIIGLYMTWLPRLDSGPLWSRMQVEKERCLTSWWTNLLYINNYIYTDKLCMFQSWYLSVDTQLFILAPAVIYPLWKWRNYGPYLLIGVTILSMLIPFTVTFLDNLDPTLMIYASEIKDISVNTYFKTNYIKTHMRAESYCIGLLYGYIVYRIQKTDQRLSKRTVRLGWFFGTLSLILSMWSIFIFYGPRKDFTAIEAAFYACLHRALWSIGTGWVILACITDNAGIIRRFLTWRSFAPLSRMTYCAYLLNGVVVLHSYSTVRTPQYLSTYKLALTTVAHMVVTFVGAFILCVIFESPILALEKIFLRKEKKMSKKREEEASG